MTKKLKLHLLREEATVFPNEMMGISRMNQIIEMLK